MLLKYAFALCNLFLGLCERQQIKLRMAVSMGTTLDATISYLAQLLPGKYWSRPFAFILHPAARLTYISSGNIECCRKTITFEYRQSISIKIEKCIIKSYDYRFCGQALLLICAYICKLRDGQSCISLLREIRHLPLKKSRWNSKLFKLQLRIFRNAVIHQDWNAFPD